MIILYIYIITLLQGEIIMKKVESWTSQVRKMSGDDLIWWEKTLMKFPGKFNKYRLEVVRKEMKG